MVRVVQRLLWVLETMIERLASSCFKSDDDDVDDDDNDDDDDNEGDDETWKPIGKMLNPSVRADCTCSGLGHWSPIMIMFENFGHWS